LPDAEFADPLGLADDDGDQAVRRVPACHGRSRCSRCWSRCRAPSRRSSR
jgi:hypothetical protein